MSLGLNKYSKHILIASLATSLFALFFIIFMAPAAKVSAAIPLNPNPVWLPSGQYNYLYHCNEPAWNPPLYSPAYATWLSLRGAPATTSISVPYNTRNVDVDLNWSGATCFSSGGSIIGSKTFILGQSVNGGATIGGFNAPNMYLGFGSGSPVGTYRGTASWATLTLPAGLSPGPHDFVVTTNQISINWFPAAPNFRCVGPRYRNPVSLDDWSACIPGPASFIIRVVVGPNPYPQGAAQEVSCNQLAGYAFDRDSTSTSVKIDVWMSNSSTGPKTLVGTFPANIYRSDVNSFFGIGGNHGFSVPGSAYNAFRNGGTTYVDVWAYGVNSSGSFDGKNAQIAFNATFGPCYRSTCTASITPSPQLPGNPYTINATFRNNGQLAWSNGVNGVLIGLTTGSGTNWWVPIDSATINGVGASHYAGDQRIALNNSVAVGSTITVSFTSTAPISISGSKIINLRLLKESMFWFGQQCSVTANFGAPGTALTIKPEPARPTLNPTNSDEPTSADFSFSVTGTGGSVRNIQIKREYLKNGVSLTAPDDTAHNLSAPGGGGVRTPSPGIAQPKTVALGAVNVGDQICLRVTVTYNSGVLDSTISLPSDSLSIKAIADFSGNVQRFRTKSIAATACTTVYNMPFLQVYGGDTFAGVSAACTGWPASGANEGGIWGNLNTTSTKGSAAQLALFSLSKIKTFNSSAFNGQGVKSLHFSNSGMTATADGGEFSATHCPEDYAGEISDTAPSTALDTIDSQPSGDYHIASVASNGFSISNGKDYRVEVVGNLTIDQNITYANTSWASITDIPSLIIVATGDIRIGKNVTRLDGTYVSQGGTINTCYQGGTNTDTQWSQCQNQLVVNGSLVANRIKFMRVYGSQRNPANPAEIINYVPEVYMTTGLAPTGTGTIKFDYWSTPPPLL